MKVNYSPTTIPLRPEPAQVARPSADARAERTSWSAGRDTAELSGTGRLVSDLRATARSEGRYGGIREDVVASVRRDMATGRFGGSDDVERAIDALLMEL
ncbi:MAG: hypothetical protein RLZZ299_1117 [Pseudomonadota bacterium]